MHGSHAPTLSHAGGGVWLRKTESVHGKVCGLTVA